MGLPGSACGAVWGPEMQQEGRMIRIMGPHQTDVAASRPGTPRTGRPVCHSSGVSKAGARLRVK